MQTFTGTEYVKIAFANAYGLDKETFNNRIEWTNSMLELGLLDNLDVLESILECADDAAGLVAAYYALEDIKNKQPSGYMVGLDSCSSGVQIMSALTNCEVGCRNTGLIDPDVRADFYANVTTAMNKKLQLHGKYVQIARNDIKPAVN